MALFTKAVLAVTGASPVRRTITGTAAGRRLAHRFVAGDTVEEAVVVTRRLNRSGMAVSLDHLGEEVHDLDTALAARRAYLACLDRIAADGLEANISVKLTQLGLALNRGVAVKALDELALRAARVGTTVTIDMEDSRFTSATVDLYAEAQGRHGNLGLALQAYLYRTPGDLDRLTPLGGHLRLCKGAYAEPPEVALQGKADVDAAYARLLGSLMADRRVRPAVATHDHRLVSQAERLAANRGGDFEFQMLYGVRTKLQEELVNKGYPLRVYVPYGSQWYPYLTRRLAERPANLGFFVRALVGR